MRNFLLPILALLCAASVQGKPSRKPAPLQMEQIQKICDSIVIEGNLLYLLEKSAWITSDLGQQDEQVKAQTAGYFSYIDGDSVRTCLTDAAGACIFETATGDDGGYHPQKNTRPLTDTEARLRKARQTIRERILTESEKYRFGFPEGFDPNFVLLPHGDHYKMYVLAGSARQAIIPFGNDYIFFADHEGRITDWRKMHSGILPVATEYEGQRVRGTTHSHLPAEPYITPTDICTFLLYGTLYGQTSFSVLSTALAIVMTYDVEQNAVAIEAIKK